MATTSRVKRRRPAGFEDHELEKRSLSPDDAFMQLARDRFKQAADADEKQRQRELDDLRFYAGDQWPEDVLIARQGMSAIGDNPAVPARPCLVINQSLQPVAQVLNQERSMDMGAELVPADDFEGLIGPIDDTEIELREGLLRRIQRAPETAESRTWAFERAAIAGRGYWGIGVRYVSGLTFDQEVYVEKYFNQACVSLDPFHESSTGSDAEWGFIGRDVPWEQYKVEFPKAAKGKQNAVLTGYDEDEDFRALGEQYPGWFTVNNKQRSCRVVTYYWTERDSRMLGLLADGRMGWMGTPPKDATPEELAEYLPDGMEPVEQREVVEKSIKWAKIDGVQKLDEGDWAGPDIPIIKVVGRELQPYDDDRRSEGLVRPMRDAGQGFNAAVSKGVEVINLAPIPPWQIAAGQDEGFEDEYLMSTTRTISALHYNTHDANGVPYPGKPERTNAGVDIGPIWASINLFGEAIKNTTLTPSATLGDVDPSLKSGRAIREVLDQAKKGTSNFLDNQARSIRREAQILNNLFYPVYGIRPGRMARIMTGEGESRTVMLGQPFVTDDKQRPQAAPAGAVPGQNGVKQYQLTDTTFNVVVKISKAYDTRRQEAAQLFSDLVAANPNEMAITGDLLFESLDSPGAKQAAERHRLMLAPPILQHIQQQKSGQAPPNPAVQAQMQQMQAAMQAMQQQLQEAQAGTQKAQIDAQTKLQIADADRAQKAQEAELKAQLELVLEQLKQQAETNRAILKLTGTQREQEAAQQHEHAVIAHEASIPQMTSAVDSL
ncbi:MAG: hypothetical protein QG656_372 [Candidatus Hydrogenedentes bacterium]|nr:hypothetical protein [Candidatus Hydrogenedentota bacterium]